MQDYYSTLGVLPSAELAVIKGAYKAMMNIYHPDKYKGDKDYAIAKSQAITNAYEILKDPVKRAAYDETLGSKHDYTEEAQEAQASCDEEQKINAEQWQYALKYYPELAGYEYELSQLSPRLVMQFRLALIENKQFSQAYVLCRQLKQEFLQRFFGNKFEIQKFASELLKSGHRDAARELNKTINFLGNDVDVDRVIESIKQEFSIYEQEPTVQEIVPMEDDEFSKLLICICVCAFLIVFVGFMYNILISK